MTFTPSSPQHDSLWQAPMLPQSPAVLQAELTIPGSKSATNRALILASIAQGPSTISGALRSRDTQLMINALTALGAVITEGSTPEQLNITPIELGRSNPDITIDAGLAGTVMRFVPLVAVATGQQAFFDADRQAYTRPMGTTLQALRALRATVETTQNPDSFPFTLTPSQAHTPNTVHIDATTSSQFLSALLLVGALFDDGLTIINDGETIPSQPHIDMTLDMLKQAGITVEASDNSWHVPAGAIHSVEWEIEPDLSNATPFLAAGALSTGSVSIRHWPLRTSQAGDAFRDILTEMGAEVTLDDETELLKVTGAGSIQGIDRDLGDVGELAPTVTALAALAETPSTLRGIAHLRGHETDRLAALRTELTALGGTVTELPDGLHIQPSDLHGGTWHSYADHRMATAGAILGLRVADIMVENIETTSKTLPQFVALWDSMLSQTKVED